MFSVNDFWMIFVSFLLTHITTGNKISSVWKYLVGKHCAIGSTKSTTAMVFFLDSKQTFGVEKGDSIVQVFKNIQLLIGTGKVHAVSCLEDVVKVLQYIRKNKMFEVHSCLPCNWSHSFWPHFHFLYQETLLVFALNGWLCLWQATEWAGHLNKKNRTQFVVKDGHKEY